jgi:YidC/Oxa1 family membrane protein insertase
MISDWSGISLEYAFIFERPVIYIDVPKKELNEEANKISLTPIEISIRKEIGYLINPDNLSEIPKIISETDNKSRAEEIKNIRSKTVFNIDKSAIIGADYITKILDN